MGTGPEGIVLPDFYLIGAGAVGAALLRTLASVPRLRGRIVVADPQEQSETDRNRLVSGGYHSVGAIGCGLDGGSSAGLQVSVRLAMPSAVRIVFTILTV